MLSYAQSQGELLQYCLLALHQFDIRQGLECFVRKGEGRGSRGEHMYRGGFIYVCMYVFEVK